MKLKNIGMFLRKIIDFFIYSNLYIGIAAVMITVESQVLLGLHPQLHPYLFLILFAVMFEYNLHKFVPVVFHKHVLTEEKFSWIAKNLKLFYFVVFASACGFIISALFAKITVLIILLPFGIVTMLYSFPIYKQRLKLFRLREVPLAKIFVIAFVWSAVTVILPLVQSGINIDIHKTILLITERFLFIFAVTIPFDIRDMESDEKAGLKTIPILLGEKNAKRTANFSLLLFMTIAAAHYFKSGEFNLAAAMIVSGSSTLFFINNAKLKKQRHYHYGILDGTLILQALLVIFFQLLFS